MQNLRKRITSIVPKYSILPLIFTVAFNMLVYVGAKIIAGSWPHTNIESPLDRMIPFFPPSALIYLGCYLFWIVNYILIARQGKERVYPFFSGEIISKAICFLFFLLIPTTNVRPYVPPDGFWNQVMTVIYTVDSADNLFPSIHCLVSWFCYIGIRGRKDIPVSYRVFSCIMALLVCISTLTTKQHVIWDVIGGIALAELCFWIGKKPAVFRVYQNFLEAIDKKIFPER